MAELAAEIDGSFVTRLGELIEAAAERGDDYMPLLDLLDAVDRAVSPPQPDDAHEVDALLAAAAENARERDRALAEHHRSCAIAGVFIAPHAHAADLLAAGIARDKRLIEKT